MFLLYTAVGQKNMIEYKGIRLDLFCSTLKEYLIDYLPTDYQFPGIDLWRVYFERGKLYIEGILFDVKK